MKNTTAPHRKFYRPTLVAAALVLAFAAATAQAQEEYSAQGYPAQGYPAQGYQGQEYIVGQEVISDTLADSGSSFVGDISSGDAGCADGNCGGSTGAGGMAIGRSYGQPDLFYNHYTQGNQNTSNAKMYVSPLPVPANVGHTFNTYQPFYPEEYLYWHKNKFHKYYDNGRGMNRTRALYYSPPVRQAASNLYWNYLRIPR